MPLLGPRESEKSVVGLMMVSHPGNTGIEMNHLYQARSNAYVEYDLSSGQMAELKTLMQMSSLLDGCRNQVFGMSK